MTRSDDRSGGDLSVARLAVAAMGAAAAVLVLVAALIVLVAPGPVVGLVLAAVGVVGAVAAMGAVSTRMTARAYGDQGRRRGRPGNDPTPGRAR